MKKRPMVLIFAGYIFGMAAVWNGMSIFAVFFYSFCSLFLLYLIRKDVRYAWLLLGAAAGAFFLLMQMESLKRDISKMKRMGADASFGVIQTVAKTKSGKNAVTLKHDCLEGKTLLYCSGEIKLKEGDEILFEGDLEVWEDSSNPGQFSSRNYYFAKGIYYHSYSDQIQILGRRKAKTARWLSKVRAFCGGQIEKQYQGDVRYFVRGMILGDKTELSDEVKDDFRESGLIHLLAVSGLHISLAGRSLYRLVQKIGGGFLPGALAGMALSCFYCLLTGASVSSVRAVCMFGVYCLAQITGECYDMLSSVGFSGICILSFRPLSICDTGFILSFTAALVIGCYHMRKPVWKGRGGKTVRVSFVLRCDSAWDAAGDPLYSI